MFFREKVLRRRKCDARRLDICQERYRLRIAAPARGNVAHGLVVLIFQPRRVVGFLKVAIRVMIIFWYFALNVKSDVMRSSRTATLAVRCCMNHRGLRSIIWRFRRAHRG